MVWKLGTLEFVLHRGKPNFFSLPASPPKYMSCTGEFVFFFLKSGGRNDAKYAFQSPFKNNTTQFAKRKKKKKKEQSMYLHDDIRGGFLIQFLIPPYRA